MTSSWLTRAFFLVAVVGALVLCVSSSAVDLSATGRRTPSPERLLEVARLCDAILAGYNDVIDARKRKWSENTMMTWGKRGGGLNTLYALSVRVF